MRERLITVVIIPLLLIFAFSAVGRWLADDGGAEIGIGVGTALWAAVLFRHRKWLL
jgi:hypothetical protein